MSEKIPVGPEDMIRYSGLCDMDGLYDLIVQWMKSRGYWFNEKSYKHKVPSPYGAEQEITFTGEKDVEDFYKFHINIDFHIWDMTEVEVDLGEGKKKQLTSLRIEIKLKGELEIDPEGRFEGSKFKEKLGHFYKWYIIKADIFDWADQLRYRMYKLHGVIKDYLDMQAKGNEYAGYVGDNK